MNISALKTIFVSTALSLPMLITFSPKAQADLIVCNNSQKRANVANAWYNQGTWNATGWSHIYPGECGTILTGDMRSQPAYIYASDDNWEPWILSNREIAGFCVRPTAFNIVDADARCVSGMISKQFYRVISENSYDFTVTLN